MDSRNMGLAGQYYTLMSEKKSDGVENFLHPEVEFHGPLATLKGKEAVFKSIQNFMKTFTSLKIRAQFGSNEQAMVVYDVAFPGMDELFPGASLLNFQDTLITRIELFYDGSRFLEKKDEIFTQ